MAHHQHGNNRQSGIQGLLKMFAISTSPTVPIVGEDDLAAEADEPPDDQLSPLQTSFPRKDPLYTKSPTIPNDRRESMLTRALLHGSSPEIKHPAPRAISNASSRSNASMASTAELTSDSDATTPSRAATPSPPLPLVHHMVLPSAPATDHVPAKISFAPVVKEASEPAVPSNEAAVEKTLGRRRCIMFACGGNAPEKAPAPPAKQEVTPTEPAPRKRMLTFACPSRRETKPDLITEVLERRQETSATPSEASQSRRSSHDSTLDSLAAQEKKGPTSPNKTLSSPDVTQRPTVPFHEFGSSADEPDEWAEEVTEEPLKKLTLTDCMRKENAIRQIGEEAEKEAEEEEQEEEDLQEDADEDDVEDDFAPSDASSDGGNESDDEGGFADSDDESDAGSDYQFWAPSRAASTTTAATSHDNILIPQFRSNSRQRHSLASSFDSNTEGHMPRQYTNRSLNFAQRRRSPRVPKMRPSTPELPDSTDFVCGTLDEDRPLEAAYISCREQRKREKHIPIPQDIDPSFPTTDPEDNDEDNEELAEGLDDHLWFRDQLDGMEDETFRGRGNAAVTQKPTQRSPRRLQSPPPRPNIVRHNTNRSPPPKPRRKSPGPRRTTLRSPPPRRLFGHSPPVQRSPPNQITMRTPPGSLLNRPIPLGITINRLAQRPALGRTASLPHAPNPYFRNHKQRSPVSSNLPSAAVTPGTLNEDTFRDRHVRGAVDIVIGLEKKRQKRKEKFWAKHCRKAAKEQAGRRPIPGKGAERMKELGLECAERTKGYGVNQQTQLVLSL